MNAADKAQALATALWSEVGRLEREIEQIEQVTPREVARAIGRGEHRKARELQAAANEKVRRLKTAASRTYSAASLLPPSARTPHG